MMNMMGGMGMQGQGPMAQDQAMRLAQARMMKGMGPRMMPGMPQSIGGNQAGDLAEQKKRGLQMMLMKMLGGQ